MTNTENLFLNISLTNIFFKYLRNLENVYNLKNFENSIKYISNIRYKKVNLENQTNILQILNKRKTKLKKAKH